MKREIGIRGWRGISGFRRWLMWGVGRQRVIIFIYEGIEGDCSKIFIECLKENNNITEDSKKLIVKIYDHFQFALHQIENVNNIFANSIEEAKENLQKEIKSVEKEYISILGIFAAIVLAFVGGITFSTSVLQNISAVSVFRLLLVVDFLAFVLINVIYILVKFIYTINEKSVKLFNVKVLNIACLVIVLVIIVAWLFNVNQLPDFIAEFLPWSNNR